MCVIVPSHCLASGGAISRRSSSYLKTQKCHAHPHVSYHGPPHALEKGAKEVRLPCELDWWSGVITTQSDDWRASLVAEPESDDAHRLVLLSGPAANSAIDKQSAAQDTTSSRERGIDTKHP